jgi:CheY-like chemotaxis protein
MLQLFLENEGFSVTTVGTVAEALALIPQYHFDVLISDAQRRTSRRWLRSSERNAANPT